MGAEKMTNIDFLKERLSTQIMSDILVQSAFHRMLKEAMASKSWVRDMTLSELAEALEELNTERREEVKKRVARRT